MSGVKGRSGGHNRKNNEFHLATGRNKDRIKTNAQDRIDAPIIEYPGLGEIGISFRNAYYEMMKNNGTWSADYSESLHLLANAAEQWHKAHEEVKQAGRREKVCDATGKIIGTKPSGLHRIERDLHDSYIQLLRDFGRSPKFHDDIKKIATDKNINPFAGKI